VVNVVAAFLVVVSLAPVYLANRLSSDTASGGRL
jgi:putative spermidine/putrescine transport system permease protein